MPSRGNTKPAVAYQVDTPLRKMQPRPTLLYVGLTIVGLLAGILATLVATRPSMLNGLGLDDAGRRVQVVELGGRSALPPIALPESLVTSGYVDALKLNQVFRMVSETVTASVVFIEVETSGGFFHQFSGGIPTSAGSGVLISPDGYVVTNNHVIEDASRIRVTLSDKRAFDAEVVGLDPNTDLAVIRMLPGDDGTFGTGLAPTTVAGPQGDGVRPSRAGGELPAIALGDSDRLQVGDWVLAVGNPFRLQSTVTAGIVSALGRQVNIIEDQLAIENFIQTDAAINPGNSGGALVNLRGELVGIATAIATESGSYEGYGFAVPVNLMQRVVRDLIEYGEVQRGYLGVTIEPIDAARARELRLPAVRGVLLGNVREGMSAWEAGLRSGDVLLSLDGRYVNEPNELQGTIALYRPGDRIRADVWRDGERRTFDVELFGREDVRARDWFAEIDRGDRLPPTQPEPGIPSPGGGQGEAPPSHPNVLDLPDWGLGLIDLGERFSAMFEIDGGAYVMYVRNDSPAAEAGVPRNSVIVAVGDVDVLGAEQARAEMDAAYERGEPALLKVRRRDGSFAWFEVER